MFKAEYTKNKLKELGMKQVWMADKLGVSSQHLSNIVNGTRKPSLKISEDMAKIMGCDYRELWTEYDDVQTTCYEPTQTFDVDEFRKQMAEQPIVADSGRTIEVPKSTVGIYLDKVEAEVIMEWLEMGGLFDLIRQDEEIDNMAWLSAWMTIYAKCKAVE